MIMINVLAVLTVAVYALMHIIAKSQVVGVPPLTFIGVTMGVVAVLALAASFATGGMNAITKIAQAPLGWLLLYAVVNFLGFILYLKVIGQMPIMQYQLIAILGPVIGGLIACAVLQEPLTPRLFAAMPFLSVGLYLALVR